MVHAYRVSCGFGARGQRLPSLSIAVIGLVLLTLVGAAGPALGEPRKNEEKADEVDTEHMFGFITGTDIGEVGDTELESETTGRLGKPIGSYTALSHMLALEYTPLENVRLEMGAIQSYHDISGVPELDDLRRGAFEGLSLEVRYRLLSREQSGIGFTILAEPHWSRIDDTSGQLVNQYGAGLALLMDKELTSNRVVAAFNLLYDPEVKRFQDTGEWSREATYGVGAGLMNQIWPGVLSGLRRGIYGTTRVWASTGSPVMLYLWDPMSSLDPPSDGGSQLLGPCRLPAEPLAIHRPSISLTSSGIR